MSTNHTMGPFTVSQTSHRGMAVVLGPDEEHLAYVTGETTAQQLRDARMFAAAPDLLSIAQKLSLLVDEGDDRMHGVYVDHAGVIRAKGSTLQLIADALAAIARTTS